MDHPPEYDSWPQEFLDGFTAIPQLQTAFSLMPTAEIKSFEGVIRMGRALQWDKKHPISVWTAMANGQKCIVKKFYPREDNEIIQIINAFPEAFDNPRKQFEQIREDTDPFVLEQRAYERIDRYSSQQAKAFFPIYYGSVCEKRYVVIEPLWSSPSLRSRCLCSNSVPDYLNSDMQLLREEIAGKELSSLEVKWYESLFINRLKRLTALHSIGTTHGDLKEDCFRLPGDFHDTVLFDFSRSYTITPWRPHTVQGRVIDSRYWERWATSRSLQKLVKVERNRVRYLINQRIDENDFRLRYGQQYEDNGERELIVMKVFREPEEAAAPDNPDAWAVSRAGSLDDYAALWIRSRHNSKGFDLVVMVASSGEVLRSWPSAAYPEGQYHLILIPRAWLMSLEISEDFVSGILSTKHERRNAWTVDRSKVQF